METLRKAMHEEGPMPGIISLTVARQASLSVPGRSKDRSKHRQQGRLHREEDGRESFSSQVNNISPNSLGLRLCDTQKQDQTMTIFCSLISPISIKANDILTYDYECVGVV